MNVYPLLRPALFALDAERSHDFTLGLIASPLGPTLTRWLCGKPISGAGVNRLGLHFPNRVGLAAGLDKDARAIDAFGAMGFGFVEVGTVTPRPQPGNDKPRLFRLPRAQALINRFGFNNEGVAALCERVEQRRWSGVLGINLGKNASTPNDRALEDYRTGLRAVHALADYVTINISSPNTQGLRDLQAGARLNELLAGLDAERQQLDAGRERPLPVVLKIAPDLDDNALADLCIAVRRHHIDGLIATNTTLSRAGVSAMRHGDEAGGLSGRPLTERAASMIKPLRNALGPEVTLIAAGGIDSGDAAQRRIEDGADLVQVYTGLIYKGPALVRKIASQLNH